MLLIPLIHSFDRKNRKGAVYYSSIHDLKSLQPAATSLLMAIPTFLRYMVIILVVLALARPQEGRKSQEIMSSGVDIIMAIDTSGSMRAMDFMRDKERIDRLEATKDVVREFVKDRPHDRLGMVAFGNEAFTQCPLTLDHNILVSFLDKLEIGIAGDSTAIGSAIGISTKRLKDLKSKSKIVILLTDGRSNAGNIPPLKAAEIAKTFGIKIYTVGMGTEGKAPFLVNTIFGERWVYKQVDLDEDTLNAIADTTGGQYFRATDKESLEQVYEQIDQMEKSEAKVIDHSEYSELYVYFLASAIGLLFLEIILTHTWLRRTP